MRPDPAEEEAAISAGLPAYLRIAGILRAGIAAGSIAPGAKLPSETQLMMRHQVSRSVAKWAVAVLKSDGLVDGRQGAGVFVRTSRRLTREPHLHIPPARPAQKAWQPTDGSGDVHPQSYRSEEIVADAVIAARLAVLPGQPVWRTTSRYLAEDVPLRQVISWRPIDVFTAPERSGWRVDQLRERVIVRPASPDEIIALALPARGVVVAIDRTYTACGVPIETADIVIPSDRCELIYQLPVS